MDDGRPPRPTRTAAARRGPRFADAPTRGPWLRPGAPTAAGRGGGMSTRRAQLTLFSLDDENPDLCLEPLTPGPFDFARLTYDLIRVERSDGRDDHHAFIGERTPEGHWTLTSEADAGGEPLYPEALPRLGKRFSDVAIAPYGPGGGRVKTRPLFALLMGALAGLRHGPARPGVLLAAWPAASAAGLALRLRRDLRGGP
jgi:hypothetical protein